LEFKIVNNKGKLKANYIPTDCTLAELTDTSAVNKAVSELLKQLGVKLTEEDKKALLSNKPSDAEIALYKGIAADRRSDKDAKAKFEALYYFNAAKNLDPDATLLKEASDKFDAILAVMKAPSPIISHWSGEDTSSNYGKTIKDTIAEWNRFKNDQEQRQTVLGQQDAHKKALLQKHEELIAYLTACMNFYDEFPPFEIRYDDHNLEREGDIDYIEGTVNIKFKIGMAPVPWKMKPWEVIIDALNSMDAEMQTAGVEGRDWYDLALIGGSFKIDAELVNGSGKSIRDTTITLSNQFPDSAELIPVSAYKNPQSLQSFVFSQVKIDNMTGTLTVKVKRVNGKDVNKNYIDVTRRLFNDTDANSSGGSSSQSKQSRHGNTANGQNDYGLSDDDSNSYIEEEHDRWV
jgi:beta-phosphoglucomutase-like phosphatase (HAD superfamily)